MKTEMFRELTGDELDLVTREILKDRLLSARLLGGGLFNTTYLAETEGHGTVVLRAGPVNRHLLLPYERFLMEAEVEVYRLCVENGIPTSEVLASDTSKTKIDRDVMFVKYIGGSFLMVSIQISSSGFEGALYLLHMEQRALQR